jgi:peptidase E
VNKYIVATSGGFISTKRWGVMRPGATFLKALELTKKNSPKVCFIMTATGDDASYISRSYEAMSELSVDVCHLALFPQPNADIEERIMNSNLIWVGGGSIANLLEVWKIHNLGNHLKNAWENGTVLSGVSAGSICWFKGGTTDSFGPELKPITNGLSFLPFANGVHYDSEEQRRPLLHSLIANKTFDLAYATDDHTGIVFENENPIEVLSDVTNTKDKIASAYKVELKGNEVLETKLLPGIIS